MFFSSPHRHQGTRRSGPVFRPLLEALEHRLAPSTTPFGDGVAGADLGDAPHEPVIVRAAVSPDITLMEALPYQEGESPPSWNGRLTDDGIALNTQSYPTPDINRELSPIIFEGGNSDAWPAEPAVRTGQDRDVLIFSPEDPTRRADSHLGARDIRAVDPSMSEAVFREDADAARPDGTSAADSLVEKSLVNDSSDAMLAHPESGAHDALPLLDPASRADTMDSVFADVDELRLGG